MSKQKPGTPARDLRPPRPVPDIRSVSRKREVPCVAPNQRRTQHPAHAGVRASPVRRDGLFFRPPH